MPFHTDDKYVYTPRERKLFFFNLLFLSPLYLSKTHFLSLFYLRFLLFKHHIDDLVYFLPFAFVLKIKAY